MTVNNKNIFIFQIYFYIFIMIVVCCKVWNQRQLIHYAF